MNKDMFSQKYKDEVVGDLIRDLEPLERIELQNRFIQQDIKIGESTKTGMFFLFTGIISFMSSMGYTLSSASLKAMGASNYYQLIGEKLFSSLGFMSMMFGVFVAYSIFSDSKKFKKSNDQFLEDRLQ